MTNSEFGDLIGWGANIPGQVNGSEAALDRMTVLINNPSELDTLRNAGVTPQMAREWYELYSYHATWQPTNPTAAGRGILMWYLYLVL